MKGLFYIGLRGYAGSGKDTVGCFLNYILENYDLSKEECLSNFSKYPKKIFGGDYISRKVKKIAFADQLKHICSIIFGVPLDAFYNGNKANAWVCINKGFEYTETEPDANFIHTAEEYYNILHTTDNNRPCWMSIRELMVYVGTYILQNQLTPNVFVNVVENQIKRAQYENSELKYVICTDVRFPHEFNYINKKFGVVINIINDKVAQLNNIAETSMDDDYPYSFTLYNNSTYEDLFKDVYDLVHDNEIFGNFVKDVTSRSMDSDIYLRLIDGNIWMICTTNKMNRIEREEDEIKMIDPSGGPTIRVGEEISGTHLIPTSINMDDDLKFVLTCENIDVVNDNE